VWCFGGGTAAAMSVGVGGRSNEGSSGFLLLAARRRSETLREVACTAEHRAISSRSRHVDEHTHVARHDARLARRLARLPPLACGGSPASARGIDRLSLRSGAPGAPRAWRRGSPELSTMSRISPFEKEISVGSSAFAWSVGHSARSQWHIPGQEARKADSGHRAERSSETQRAQRH
jgi:hypothetical protein